MVPSDSGCIVLRTCIGCRAVVDKQTLARLVLDSAGFVVVDAEGRRPGRGAYLHARRGCLDSAVRSKAFARAFRADARAPDLAAALAAESE